MLPITLSFEATDAMVSQAARESSIGSAGPLTDRRLQLPVARS